MGNLSSGLYTLTPMAEKLSAVDRAWVVVRLKPSVESYMVKLILQHMWHVFSIIYVLSIHFQP